MTFRLTEYVRPETDVQVSLRDASHVLLPSDAIFNSWELRNASGPAEGARRKRVGCLAGWPDCSVWWQGRVVLIELKRTRGWALSPAQKSLHARLESAGFPVAVCHTVEEALGAVAAAGIPLRGHRMRA